MRKRIRRRELAEQFSVNIRTIDAWAKTGALPKPHKLPGSRVPLWYVDETVDGPVRDSGKRRNQSISQT
jgi:hypothetical protein